METYIATNLTVDFKINRIVEKRLICSHYDLILDLEIDPEFTAAEQTKKLSQLKYWIDSIVNGCIAFNVHSTLANTEILGELENFIMFCPDEPNDYLILLLIVAKLNAIGEGVVTVEHASIGSDTNQGFGNVLTGNPLEMLISPEDWMGKTRYFKEAWWNRPDGGMMDIPCGEEEDPEKKPDILIPLETETVFIADNTTNTEIVEIEKPSAEIIKLNFKPRIIKNDDQT